jgi:hypothetical protein
MATRWFKASGTSEDSFRRDDLDAGGRPVKSVDGYAGARITRNERGQPLEITYHDDEGAGGQCDPGSAKRRFTYDFWVR